MELIERTSNCTTIFGKVAIFRHGRAARLSWEWHEYSKGIYLMVGWASPDHHRRWARTVYVYMPSFFPLNRIPSTGNRSYRDSWAPLNPWRGRWRPWMPESKRLVKREG